MARPEGGIHRVRLVICAPAGLPPPCRTVCFRLVERSHRGHLPPGGMVAYTRQTSWPSPLSPNPGIHIAACAFPSGHVAGLHERINVSGSRGFTPSIGCLIRFFVRLDVEPAATLDGDQ